MTSREEEMISTLAERIPLRIGKRVKASNRGATAFLNKLRADNFDRLIDNAKAAGLNPEGNPKLLRELAGFVNNASGRGNLGKLEEHAAGLNAIFFSPRFMASRLQMMNPVNYTKTNPMVRKEYLKSVLSIASAWGGLATLSKMNGAEVGDNPTSTDFGKIKIGNTTLDPGAGFQQWLVLGKRLQDGTYTTSTGNEREYGVGFGSKTRGDALVDFFVNKLAPIPGFGARAMRANESNPFSLGDESLRLFTPMLAQDLSEIVQEDPNLLPLLIPAGLGMGVQTPDERGNPTRLLGDAWPKEMDINIPAIQPVRRRR
jgi:hypothetical protein